MRRTNPGRSVRRAKFAADTGLAPTTADNYHYVGPTAFDLQLTPYVLSHARKDDCRHCLIALALEVAINKPDQHILPIIDAVSMRWTEDNRRFIMRTPAQAALLIADFDAGRHIPPQAIHITGDLWEKRPSKILTDHLWNIAHPEPSGAREARRQRRLEAGEKSTFGSIPSNRLVKQRYIDRGLDAPDVQS